MSRCLVTGAGGLIGAHIVRQLLDGNHRVRALVRPGGSRIALENLPVDVVDCDVLASNEALVSAFRDCDILFHTAAYFSYAAASSEHLRRLAETGTENVMVAAAAAGVRRVVVTSSSVVFGYRSTVAEPLDETAALSRDQKPAYVGAKVAQHIRAVEIGSKYGLEVLLACPTITVGPTAAALGPSNGLVVSYLNDALRCTFPGGCNIVAAKDVAQGHILLALRGVPGESYLLGSESLHWRDIHTLISELAGVSNPGIELSHAMAFLAAAAEELRAGFQGRSALTTRDQTAMIGRYYWYSHSKATRLGYAPMPARAALTEAISWLAASPHVSREVRAGLQLSNEVYRFRARHIGSNPALGMP